MTGTTSTTGPFAESFAAHRARLAAGERAETIAREALEAARGATGCFTVLCETDDVLAAARAVDVALARGEPLPLAGLPFCVKDNLDVAGMVSTSNCPGFGAVARRTAPAVRAALDAGAVLIGRNTMDQFATGLNGTRSPVPPPRNVIDPRVIPGGSSSGSAVAVALGVCAFALGSDTGGSGRVPAAANGIVGLKPTPGLVSGRGMVYCNRSFDVVPIFAREVADARAVFDIIGGPDPLDPFAYRGVVAGGEAPECPVIAVPDRLDHFGDVAAAQAHRANLEGLARWADLVPIDFAPFAEAGRLVFDGALVAERLVDYGDFIEVNRDAVVPAVASAIDAGRARSAREAFEALHRLAELKVETALALEGAHALVVPTVARLFTVDEMRAEPLARNTIMGTYTYFANPLGLCAVAVPGVPRSDGLPSSVSFVGRPGADASTMGLAAQFEHAMTFA